MNDVKYVLSSLIGEWSPISEGHFAGIDFQWLASALVVAVVFVGLFGLLRSVARR